MWLPHTGQCLRVKREHGNAEDIFSIAVREHSGTRVDKNVDDGWTSSLFP